MRAVVLALTLIASTAQTAGALDAYRWERRLLLIFAPETAGALADQRAAVAAERRGFDDRDLTLVVVSGPAARAEDGAGFDADGLRARFDLAASDVAAVLIGKDGGEKLRVRDRPMAMAELFAAIDVMPMRRREMERRR